jgi:hypothetical protein
VISRIAERALADAGAEVIPTDAYYRQYSGRPMYVSAWEGHPNEVANYIWATMIAGRLKKRADLEKYRLKNGSE